MSLVLRVPHCVVEQILYVAIIYVLIVGVLKALMMNTGSKYLFINYMTRQQLGVLGQWLTKCVPQILVTGVTQQSLPVLRYTESLVPAATCVGRKAGYQVIVYKCCLFAFVTGCFQDYFTTYKGNDVFLLHVTGVDDVWQNVFVRSMR